MASNKKKEKKRFVEITIKDEKGNEITHGTFLLKQLLTMPPPSKEMTLIIEVEK